MIIWIASYPKSGNTWVRSIISLLLFSKDGIMQNFDLLNSIDQYPTRKYFLNLVKIIMIQLKFKKTGYLLKK